MRTRHLDAELVDVDSIEGHYTMTLVYMYIFRTWTYDLMHVVSISCVSCRHVILTCAFLFHLTHLHSNGGYNGEHNSFLINITTPNTMHTQYLAEELGLLACVC